MGDSERWPEASGLSPEGAHSFRAALDTFRGKGEEWWARAELRAAELLTSIQPNPASELRRQAVVDYVTKLIQSCVNCQVVNFGSVPLKTYLPDGDIDLTVVSPNLDAKRTWIDDVHTVLQKEIANPNSEFRVTQVHLVSAEVKIIKICVEKLLVDVSFDQLGGVCTLCFLEEVDRLIGEDHLFKRSIILVKAWCYYESRLLGANCNLMSTYALETLVLYIFHLFHASLRGPLQVLYLFLEFFSSFDWDKYCVSLSSPVLLESFSKEAERQEDFQRPALSSSSSPGREEEAVDEGGELLFTKAFLDACERTYGLLPVNHVAKPPTKFAVKSLNIIDPLRSTNNLGRSVNQGNCARIRRAFVLGARTLRSILHAGEADVATELDQFFKTCCLRYHRRWYQRPDVAPGARWKAPPNNKGMDRIEAPKRTNDVAKTESLENEEVAQNGKIHHLLPVVEYDEGGDESAGGSNPPGLGEAEVAFVTNGLASRSRRHVDDDEEEEARVSVSISGDEASQSCVLQMVCVRLAVVGAGALYVEEEEELSPGGMLRESLNSTGHEALGRRDHTTANGNHVTRRVTTNGATSPCSKNDTEEEEESSSRSSSLKGEVAASENAILVGAPDCRGSRLPQGFHPPTIVSTENFERATNGSLSSSSSELQGRRTPDAHHSTPDADADADVAAAQTPPSSYSHEQSVMLGVRNEEDHRAFAVPVDAYNKQPAGNGFEYPGVVAEMSKLPRRKGRAHQQQNGFQSRELDGSGAGKQRRGHAGKSKGTWSVVAQDGGQVNSSSSTTAGASHSSQQPSVSVFHRHPARHAAADVTPGMHFKGNSHQSQRPYPNASGPGSFRHPLANYQFDPGTARRMLMTTTAGGSSSSNSASSLQYITPSSYYAPPVQFSPGFLYPRDSSMYSPSVNVHKCNSPSKWDGSSGAVGTNKHRMDPDTVGSVEAAVDITQADSPSNNRSQQQPKLSEQVAVGIVERLEADGVAASTSSRRSQGGGAARIISTHGVVPSGHEFLTGNLKLYLDLLAYGRFCEYSCSPSPLHQVGYPASYGAEPHVHSASWEGPVRSERAQLVGGQHPFYVSGPGWFPLFHQAGYFPQHLQPFWGPRGVELSPRPRGTGTYLPNTQLRQSIKVPGGRGRGVGQSGSQQPQEDNKYHHPQLREHENAHHHRASTTSRDEAHNVHNVVHGPGGIHRVGEARILTKAERAHDSHHPKPELARTPSAASSHSLSTSPPVVVSSLCVSSPGDELPHASELLLLRADFDSADALDVRQQQLCGDSFGGPPVVVTLSGSSEGDDAGSTHSVSPPVEFLDLEDDGGTTTTINGPQLKRSASVGHAYDVVKADNPVTISGLSSAIGEVIPTATTSLRNGRQTYHMKEEDFPPLEGRRANCAEVATGGTSNGMATNGDDQQQIRLVVSSNGHSQS